MVFCSFSFGHSSVWFWRSRSTTTQQRVVELSRSLSLRGGPFLLFRWMVVLPAPLHLSPLSGGAFSPPKGNLIELFTQFKAIQWANPSKQHMLHHSKEEERRRKAASVEVEAPTLWMKLANMLLGVVEG